MPRGLLCIYFVMSVHVFLVHVQQLPIKTTMLALLSHQKKGFYLKSATCPANGTHMVDMSVPLHLRVMEKYLISLQAIFLGFRCF